MDIESSFLMSPDGQSDVFKYIGLKNAAENSLYEFHKQAWPWIEGEDNLEEGWYLEGISKVLEAAFRREIRRSIINIFPRSGKSSLMSISYPAWCWIHKPS